MTFQPTVTSDYAVRAMVELAATGRSLKAHEIHERQGIPGKYVENVLAKLRRAGLVTARRGNRGGYRLAAAPHQIDLAQIVAAVEDLDPPAWIALHGQGHGSGSPLAETWALVVGAPLTAMRAISLADLAAAVEHPADPAVS